LANKLLDQLFVKEIIHPTVYALYCLSKQLLDKLFVAFFPYVQKVTLLTVYLRAG